MSEAARPLYERHCRYCGRVFTHPAQYAKAPQTRKYTSDLWWYWCRWGCPGERQ